MTKFEKMSSDNLSEYLSSGRIREKTADGKKSHKNNTQSKKNDKSETESQRATFKDLGNQIMALKDEAEPTAIKSSVLKKKNCK